MLPLPLALLRVLDLTQTVAGAMATRFLADLGAEVIVVERPGPSLRQAEPALFDHLGRNKYACAIDLSRAEGHEACLRLAAACDLVFVDADDAGLDLDYAEFAAARPDVICVRIAVGVDRPGLGVGAAAAALTALFHRRATGEGGQVDVSFPRLAASLQSAAIAAASLPAGQAGAGLSTPLPDLSPSGCYGCADGAIAVVVRSQEQVGALARAIGRRTELVEGVREALAGWLAGRPAGEAAAALLAAGVAAQPLLDLEAVVADPHLRAAGFFEPVAQAGGAVREMEGVAYRFSATPAHVRLPPPAFGEHTDVVLRDLAGLSAEAVAALRAAGAVAGSAPGTQ